MKAPLYESFAPYFVYILFSQKDHLLYIGYSANLEKRISNHNNGFTKSTLLKLGYKPLQHHLSFEFDNNES